MKHLLEYIILGITSKPENISIDEQDENGTVVLKLKVDDEDFGTVIGKGGRTIKAIRDLLRLKALKENLRFNFSVEEPAQKPQMRIEIITAFPKVFSDIFSESIIKIAQQKVSLRLLFMILETIQSTNAGLSMIALSEGGPGMVLMIEPIYKAVKHIESKLSTRNSAVYILSPQGKLFNQEIASKMSKKDHLILICGHYEGVDERVIKLLKAKELSIGNFVLSGGEIPAMVVTDAIVRLIPGVLGQKASLERESFSNGYKNRFDFPNYTRPRTFIGLPVPRVLLNGDHRKIKEWREKSAMAKLKKNRPDLLDKSIQKD